MDGRRRKALWSFTKVRSRNARRNVLKGLTNIDNNHIIRELCIGVDVYACEFKMLIMRAASMRGSERPVIRTVCDTLEFDKLQHHKYQPYHNMGA